MDVAAPRQFLAGAAAAALLLVGFAASQSLAAQVARKPPASRAASQTSVITASQRHLARVQFQESVELLLLKGDKAKARQGFLRAILLDPRFPAPYFNLGVLDEASGNWPQASHWFQSFLRLDPNSRLAPRVKAEIARIRRIERQRATPRGRAESAYDDDIARARVLLNARMLKPAIATAAKAAVVDPKRWEAYALTASALSQAGRVRKAEKFLSMAIARAPQSRKAALYKALAGIKAKSRSPAATPASPMPHKHGG